MLKQNYSEYIFEAGCDEAGRGCLAGPVFAAAVILPLGFENELLNDSKQLSESMRNTLRKVIEEEASYWAVASISSTVIDKINILNASILAMHNALDMLKAQPEYIIVDGNRFKDFKSIPYKCIVKGDSEYLSIAAASVLAKTYRDEFMHKLHEQMPQYKWNENKGYATAEHRNAIARFGISSYHRKSFSLNQQLRIKF
jgi:ribonuclease HII